MKYEELKAEIDAMPGARGKDYRKLLSVAGPNGKVWKTLEAHLEAATTAREFFEAVYNDDECRFENVWAEWAKLERKRWVGRFVPQQAVGIEKLQNKGVFLQNGANEILIPVPVRGRDLGVYVFNEGGFNTKAAEYFSSINGTFTCEGLTLEGAFDVYRAHHAVIFERWALDQFNRRANGNGQIRTGCDCAAVW